MGHHTTCQAESYEISYNREMPVNAQQIKVQMAGRTITAVAESAGMARPDLSILLSGRGNPTVATLDRLAQALGCDVRDLLSR